MTNHKPVELNARERTQCLVTYAVIDSMTKFQKTKAFEGFLPEHKKYFRTALTYLIKFRDQSPKSMDRKTHERLYRDVTNNHLDMVYNGAKQVTVNGEELDKLMEYAVMGMCRDCTLTGKAAERCPFRREWKFQLIESDCPTGDCPYSFSFDKNKAWGENNG